MILLAVLAGLQTPGAAPKSAQACTSAALVGTWQVASAKLGDEVSPTGPNDPVKYKHLTPTHFVVYQVTKDGMMNWAHGGPYTFAGDTYTERFSMASANLSKPWGRSLFRSSAVWRAGIPGTSPVKSVRQLWMKLGNV